MDSELKAKPRCHYCGGAKRFQVVSPVSDHAWADCFCTRAPDAKAEMLWLWQNFVDGKPEYWAFDNPFPTQDGGDPLTLGEPCGWAVFKPSVNGRPDVSDDEVRRSIPAALSQAKAETVAEIVAWLRDGVRRPEHANLTVGRDATTLFSKLATAIEKDFGQ